MELDNSVHPCSLIPDTWRSRDFLKSSNGEPLRRIRSTMAFKKWTKLWTSTQRAALSGSSSANKTWIRSDNEEEIAAKRTNKLSTRICTLAGRIHDRVTLACWGQSRFYNNRDLFRNNDRRLSYYRRRLFTWNTWWLRIQSDKILRNKFCQREKDEWSLRKH